jgi:hypothetical protein
VHVAVTLVRAQKLYLPAVLRTKTVLSVAHDTAPHLAAIHTLVVLMLTPLRIH